MSPSQRSWRVLVFEVNEISWELMQPFLDRNELPNFRRLQAEGSWGRTFADEPSGPEGLLEPWVTWVTVYSGVPQAEHGAQVLEQPVDSIKAKRLWEYVSAAGKRIGIYGSIGSWPPLSAPGFFVPGSFSPDCQTHPDRLRPIQDLNLRYTRSHAPGVKAPGLGESTLRAMKLLRLGLNVSTILRIIRTLAEIKLYPHRDWKKVCLQPIVNMAFFRKLFRQERPDFATFHTNHVAHFQHRFMRAWRPEVFPDPTEPQEVERFKDAIHFGYLVADQLLGQFMRLCDRAGDIVLCVASSMGQKPYIPTKYGEIAPPTCRLRSIERLVDILSLEGRCEYFSTMAPQWNLRIADESLRKEIVGHLHAARYQPANKTAFHAAEVQDYIVVTPMSHHGVGPGTDCTFPTLRAAPTFPFEQLVIQADDTRKSGCHDPVGMVGFYGGPTNHGKMVGEVNNMDLAPTFLALMGLAIPPVMKGRVIGEAFRGLNSTPTLSPVS